jgi:hypothetical protein
VLHDQRIANRFYIDGHWPAVIGGVGTSGDMRMGAALILSIGKRKKPVGNVHLLKRNVHDGGNGRVGEASVIDHGVLLSGH